MLKTAKRTVSVIVLVAMLCSMLPMMAARAEEEEKTYSTNFVYNAAEQFITATAEGSESTASDVFAVLDTAGASLTAVQDSVSGLKSFAEVNSSQLELGDLKYGPAYLKTDHNYDPGVMFVPEYASVPAGYYYSFQNDGTRGQYLLTLKDMAQQLSSGRMVTGAITEYYYSGSFALGDNGGDVNAPLIPLYLDPESGYGVALYQKKLTDSCIEPVRYDATTGTFVRSAPTYCNYNANANAVAILNTYLNVEGDSMHTPFRIKTVVEYTYDELNYLASVLVKTTYINALTGQELQTVSNTFSADVLRKYAGDLPSGYQFQPQYVLAGAMSSNRQNRLMSLSITTAKQKPDFTQLENAIINEFSDISAWNVYGGTEFVENRNGVFIVGASSDKQPFLVAKEDVYTQTGERVKMVKYTFRKSDPKSGAGVRVVYDVTDENNYKYLTIQNGTDGTWAQRWRRVNGVDEGDGSSFHDIGNEKIDLSVDNVAIFDYTSNGKCMLTIGNYTFELDASGANPRPAFSYVSKTSGEVVYYKNISVVTVPEEDEFSENRFITNFKKEHKEVLMLPDNMISINYESMVNGALDDYETLSSYGKEILSVEKNRLESIKDEIARMKDNGVSPLPEYDNDTLTDFTDNFENGLTQWCTLSEKIYKVEIVEDGGKAGNHVLAIKGSQGEITPNTFSYPQKAFLKTLSYRIKLDFLGSLMDPAGIMLWYQDSDNYESLQLARSGNNVVYRHKVMKNGVVTGYGDSIVCKLDYVDKWLNIDLTYNQQKSSGFLTISSDQSEDTDTFSFTIPQGFRAALASNGAGWMIYVDDVVATFEKATWEDPVKLTKPVVYYTGNTGADPGDVITVHGKDYTDTVSKCEIIPIPQGWTVPGYIKQGDFSTAGQESQFIGATDAMAYWNILSGEIAPAQVKLISRSRDQIKFVLPPDSTGGIYALKIYGFDNESDDDDTVIYINTPKISFVQGNDGDIVTQGQTLKIVGENLALHAVNADTEDYIDDEVQQNVINDNVQVMLKNADRQYIFGKDHITVKSEQYLYLDIPEYVEDGEYEVFAYNGYGDDSCWSMPCEDTVNVAAPRWESWPQTVYNVKDFGATGDKEQNATGFIVDALTACAENGGGIVYLPRGIYTVIHSLFIPENVQIMGEGISESVIFWCPDPYAIGECSRYMVGFTGNVRFADVSFYGTRTGDVFVNYGSTPTAHKANVYFENIYLKLTQYGGIASYTTGGEGVKDLSVERLQNQIKAETDKITVFTMSDLDNLRFENVKIIKQNGRGFVLGGENHYLGHSYFTSPSGATGTNNYLTSDKKIIEYNYTEGCQAVEGYKCMIYGNRVGDAMDNNRELHVADGAPESNGGISGGIVRKDTTDATNRTYVLINRSPNENRVIGCQMYVVAGNGQGEVRIITGAQYKTTEEGRLLYLTVNEPFVYEPNQGSTVVIRLSREDNYYANNSYTDGLTVGYFGGFANVVFDNNYFAQVSNIYIYARANDVNWYYTTTNNLYTEGFANHHYGPNLYPGNDEDTGFSFLYFYSTNYESATVGITLRDNVYDGYYLRFDSKNRNGITGITIEGNTFITDSYALDFYTTITSLDNLVLSNNSFTQCANIFKPDQIHEYPTTQSNDTGFRRYQDLGDSVATLLVGDVNGDGEITQADAEAIKDHLSGKITLTENEAKRADFFADGAVTARDSTAILYWLATGIKPAPEDMSGEITDNPGGVIF